MRPPDGLDLTSELALEGHPLRGTLPVTLADDVCLDKDGDELNALRWGWAVMNGKAVEVVSKRGDMGLAVICSAVVAAQTYQYWLLYNGVLPAAGPFLGLASGAQGLSGVLASLLVLLAALKKPALLSPPRLLGGTLACCAIGFGLLWYVRPSPELWVVGLVLRSLGSQLGYYLLGIALSRVRGPRCVAIGVAFGVLVSDCAATFLPVPPIRASLALDCAITSAGLMLTWRVAAPALSDVARGPGGSALALASPRSFLAPNHQVFVLMFIFSVAMGFASSLRVVASAPLSTNLSIVALVFVVAWFVLAPSDHGHEDGLFFVSSLLVAAGFLAVPLEDTGVANDLLYAGKLAFHILAWITMASLCARNCAGSIMVLACGALANGVGSLLGGGLGGLCSALLVGNARAAAVLTSLAVLGLFAYVLAGLRGFSFAATIRGVEPATQPAPSVPLRDELFESSCDSLAATYCLTEREREVLGMLARGRNSYHICDELTLSYNTVKTHIKRIYGKLGVHSQQELIDLVEREVITGGVAPCVSPATPHALRGR